MTSAIRRFIRRLWSTIRPDRGDLETRREIAAHLAMLEEDFRRQGFSPAGAYTAARRSLGGADLTLALTRDARLFPSLDDLRRDAGYAVRTLTRAPAFAVVSVLTLALGIGGTTAIGSLAYGALVRPLPIPDAARTVVVSEGADGNAVTFGNFVTWRERSREFDHLGAWMHAATTLSSAAETTRVAMLLATADIFKVLAVPPAAGRYFSADEDRPGAARVVVLSHHLWQAQFAGDARIVGRSIVLDAEPHMVVGVASEAYEHVGITTDLWIPLALTPELVAQHADHELMVYGLVRRGRSIQAARTELLQIERQLKREYPNAGLDGVVRVSDLREARTGEIAPLLFILGAASALLLVLAGTNVLNLLLARAAARQQEFAVRIALGASRTRVVTQLLVESIALGAAAGIAGLLVASWFLGFANIVWPFLDLWQPATGGTIATFAAVISLACGVVLGLVPAFQVLRTNVQPALRDAGQRPSRVTATTRNALVAVELVLAVMLVSGAALLIRTAMALEAVPAGFEAKDRTAMRIALPGGRYRGSSAVSSAFTTIQAAVQHVPGVQTAALTTRLPLDRGADCGVVVEGEQAAGGPIANFRTVTGNYFSAMGVPLRSGRSFDAQDTKTSPAVTVINDMLARKLFGAADPLGRRIALCPQMSAQPPLWLQVVGVVASMRSDGLRHDPPSELFMPLGQGPADSTMTLVLYSTEPLGVIAPAIRKTVHDFDPLVPVFGVRTLEDVVARDRALARWLMELFAALGVMGLLLAVIGVYGVVSYFVSQRAHEIGVRIAIGASRAQVMSLVLRQGSIVALCGIATGVVATLATANILDAVLFGVTSHDWPTFAVVALVLFAAALVAVALPARRAARLDPVITLRA